MTWLDRRASGVGQTVCALVVLLLVLWAPGAWAADFDVTTAMARLRTGIASRYMWDPKTCTAEDASAWPGYETLPAGTLQRCTYTVAVCAGTLPAPARKACAAKAAALGSPVTITATVVLLVPGNETIARWLVSACRTVGVDREGCLVDELKRGEAYGNWQIPIAGLVFEGLPPNDYVQHGYAFRDGMTVVADGECGWRNGSDDGNRQPSAAENAACSRPLAIPLKTSARSRPSGTTRDMLVAWQPQLADALPPLGPGALAAGPARAAWADYVRRTLVEAMHEDANPLVTAVAVYCHSGSRRC